MDIFKQIMDKCEKIESVSEITEKQFTSAHKYL